MPEATVVERIIGTEKLVIESGKLAFQAHGSAVLTYGDTVVLATAVMADKPRADIDFLPLTVEFEERLYSAGKIPGSFFRREGRPGQDAILSARLTDRSIRPLFPKGLHNEIQVILTVLSADQKNPPEILGMIGASTALSVSHLPFSGPHRGLSGFLQRRRLYRQPHLRPDCRGPTEYGGSQHPGRHYDGGGRFL